MVFVMVLGTPAEESITPSWWPVMQFTPGGPLGLTQGIRTGVLRDCHRPLRPVV